MIIALPLLVMVIGLVLYLGADGKVSAIGLEMFWVGLFITLWNWGPYLSHTLVVR